MTSTEAWFDHCAGCGSCAWFTRGDGTRYCGVCGGEVAVEEPPDRQRWWIGSYELVASRHLAVSLWPCCWEFGAGVDLDPPGVELRLFIGPVRILVVIGGGDAN